MLLIDNVLKFSNLLINHAGVHSIGLFNMQFEPLAVNVSRMLWYNGLTFRGAHKTVQNRGKKRTFRGRKNEN